MKTKSRNCKDSLMKLRTYSLFIKLYPHIGTMQRQLASSAQCNPRTHERLLLSGAVRAGSLRLEVPLPHQTGTISTYLQNLIYENAVRIVGGFNTVIASFLQVSAGVLPFAPCGAELQIPRLPCSNS